ncbi:Oidioi.mRNA.OKI2018_I69.chr1.g2933.t1.cds [Oikopleura dioica]|uniref:Oidioi.mRNA.OKI2018_I69.chr1.g2933.t1.cds n=1 Tax=Oikopleura dioica TaxID=34765 RepID=A0ABN7SZ17_OIKDI|nr:Oidioi.mRNA.OKI2018_I69.chr1.g2933.t1.cds [Oikopleura dioica]
MSSLFKHFLIITDSDASSEVITGWQPPSSIRYHKGDRYGLRQYIQVEKAESETQCNFGDKVFSSPADVVKALFNQLLPSDQVAGSISSSEDAGWSHGWSCRSESAQTVEFPELMHLKLKPAALGRPSRKSRLTEPLPYLGLEPSTTSSGFNPASLSASGPVMIFGCDQSFRRDEISEHLANIHDGVIPNLYGTIIERCPMHRYGCNFYRNRLVPDRGHLKHDTVKKCWPCPQKVVRNRRTSIGLADMPVEVLIRIIKNLDSYSMKSLLATNYDLSVLVDDIMSDCGMVLSQWKKTEEGWSLDFKWTFSNHSKPANWRLSDEPAIGAHLTSCSFLKSSQTQYGTRPLPQIGMARGTQVRDLPFSY